MTTKPISRVIFQAADGTEYYSAPWDLTLAVSLVAGSGTAALIHNGVITAFVASDPGATAAPFTVQGGASYPTLAAALAAVPSGGTITVAAGSYAFAQAAAHVPASAGNVTISAAPGTVTFDGQQFNATGTNGKPRGIWGKAFLHASDPITVTVSGIAFVNCGDPTDSDTLAALYAEGGAGLVVTGCAFDGCGDGIFGAAGAGGYTGTANKFGQHATNGVNQPGYSHDVYWNGATLQETDCLHLGNATGHSLKARCATTGLTRGLYTSIGGGRAIDVPDGGQVTLNGIYVDQAAGADANLLGFGDESAKLGTPAVTWIGGTLAIRRQNTQLMMPNGGALTASGVGQFFEPAAQLVLIGSGTVVGLVMQSGTGTLTTAPARPG